MPEDEPKPTEQNATQADTTPKKVPKRKEVAAAPAEQMLPQPESNAVLPAPEKKVVRVTKKTPVTVGEHLIFGKYSAKDIVVRDPSIAPYITFSARQYPNIYGRRKYLAYYTSHITIVERLINKLMRGGTGKKVGGKVIKTEGRLQGKKLKVMHVVEDAFDSINKNTGKNPLQVLVDALQNSAPIEDTTRVRYGGISYNVAVGISAERRLNVALKNVALAALVSAFRARRSLSEALASELTQAANKDPNSYAIKKKVELERIARSAR